MPIDDNILSVRQDTEAHNEENTQPDGISIIFVQLPPITKFIHRSFDFCLKISVYVIGLLRKFTEFLNFSHVSHVVPILCLLSHSQIE